MIVLVWVYLLALSLFLGAELNAARTTLRQLPAVSGKLELSMVVEGSIPRAAVSPPAERRTPSSTDDGAR